MMFDARLREIKKRNLEHFKKFGALSSDPQANDIRDILEHVDELNEELDRVGEEY
jgi:DNA-directed RNA polymerase subunit F